jgi:hypothetical protein
MPGFDPHHVVAALAVQHTYPATNNGLAAALAALGATETEVAETLSRGGCRGRRGSSCACPVAIYLHAVILDAESVLVEATETFVHLDDGTKLDAATPEPVYAFMAAFDKGTRYQDLSATPYGSGVQS